MERRADIQIVGEVDSTPSAVLRLLAFAAALFHGKRWRNVYRKGRLMRWARSRTRDRRIRHIESDFVLHVRNTYLPAKRPYLAFLDNVSSISQTQWPAWRLPVREFRARQQAEVRFLTGASFVFTAGEHVAEEIVNSYGVEPAKVASVGGGVNAMTAPNEPIARNWKQVLFVGLDFQRKGGEVLVEAFQRVLEDFQDAKLVVVGSVAPENAVTREQITYLGRVWDRSELSRIYAESGIFCLPALFERFGLVAVEAMQNGLACIVSNKNELPYLVQDRVTGLVVDSGSVDDLERALRVVIGSSELAQAMGEAALANSDSMTWEKVVDRMVRVFG